MKKIIIAVLVVIVLALAFILYLSNRKYFTAPDIIIIYIEGNTKTISKDDELFHDIIKLTNKRANSKLSITKLGFHKDEMNSLMRQEIVLEFIYSKNQVSSTGRKRSYTHAIFPLTGEYNDLCFFENDDGTNFSGPIGPLNSPYLILDLLK